MPDEMQQFLQSAVHDLRAAQRQTGTAAELLLQAADDRERKDLLERLIAGVSKTEYLLSAISRYAAALGPLAAPPAVFPAASAVRFALAHLDPQLRETGVTLTFGDLPEIQGDQGRLAEVFEILIGNSLKFRGPDPPRVAISSRRLPEGWLFSIEDNGIGIPAKYRDRLFIPFRRLHGADVPGAGLGLAIAMRIVEAHRGRIWIDSQEPPGVVICFVLPAPDGD